ncbi:uncharacterized protein LOC125939741 [Dermacentor silvarum]|uniref:uncharacterized protein LOC125939741 n=1 Tax=Dermacentor silvarum TaxID=543639 RepID=UPI002100FEA5|nr:uncharacterized protein LOC125939741 [Dermacentor silvarum]
MEERRRSGRASASTPEASTSEGSQLPACLLGPTDCHKTTQSKQQQIFKVQDLSEVYRRLLRMRCKRTQDISTVCSHHYTMFVKRYTTHMASKWCSNPFLVHVKNVRGTCIITTTLADLQPTLGLIPGERLCVTCKRKCYTTPKATSSECALQESGADSDPSEPEVATEDLNETLAAIGVSPLKRKRGRKARQTYARKEVKRLQKSTEKAVYSHLGLQQPSTSAEPQSDEFSIDDYITLMKQLKEKYDNARGRLRKIQILTLAPISWSREKVVNYFGASEREAREAIRIRAKDVFLARRQEKRDAPSRKKSNFQSRRRFGFILSTRKKRLHPRSTKMTAFAEFAITLRGMEKKLQSQMRILFIRKFASTSLRFGQRKWHPHSLRVHGAPELQTGAQCHRLHANNRRIVVNNCMPD